MADYKAMYLTAMDAMERAIALLAEAQQKCEDLYVATSGEELLGVKGIGEAKIEGLRSYVRIGGGEP